MIPAVDLNSVVEQTWIDQAHFLWQTDSTNSKALEHARRTQSDLTELFFTEAQVAGRGRGQHRWWSGPGALTFSVLQRPLDIDLAQLCPLALAAGVAVCRALQPHVPAAQLHLKWPNDIFLNDRKVGGILIETTGRQNLPPARTGGRRPTQTAKPAAAGKPADRPLRAVVGMGLNVNNPIRQAPTALHQTAVSLVDVAGHPLDRTAVLSDCLTHLQDCLHMLLAGDARLPQLWREYSLLTGKWLCLETPQGTRSGTCQSIADDGALLLAGETADDKEVRAYYSGSVTKFHAR